MLTLSKKKPVNEMSSPSPPCPLLNLPVELRLEIYQIVLDRTPLHVYRKNTQNDYALVLACKQIFEEALPTYRPFMESLLPLLDDEIEAQREETKHIIGLGPAQAMNLCLDRRDQIKERLRLWEKMEELIENSRAWSDGHE